MKEYKVGDVLTRKNGKVYDVVESDGRCHSLASSEVCSFHLKKACQKYMCDNIHSNHSPVVFIKRKEAATQIATYSGEVSIVNSWVNFS